MENKEIMKQMMELNKTSFENSFNMLVTIQDQMEKMVNNFVDMSPWFPSEGKKAFVNMMSMCKKSREEFKKILDDGYKKIEEYIV